VTGPTELQPPPEVETIGVMTADEMRAAVVQEAADAGVVVMAAAVADWRPAEVSLEKLKKRDSEAGLNVAFVRTPDVLAELGRDKRGRVLVGFAAETNDLAANARRKIEEKNLDLIVANLVGRESGQGFAAETNRVTLFGRDGSVEELPLMSKRDVARAVFDRVAGLLSRAGTR